MDHNHAAGGNAQGGGIFNAGWVNLIRSLVNLNDATAAGGGIFKDSGTVTLTNSIVKDNSPDNCSPPGSVSGCTG